MNPKLKEALRHYHSLEGAVVFFKALGYPTLSPLPYDLSHLPDSAQQRVDSLHQLVQVGDTAPFRIFHAELDADKVSRTDLRRFLEAFYRHEPQGENLFVFTPKGRYEELTFVSPRRIPHPRDPLKVHLWLRTLQVRPTAPYRTDLEVLKHIRYEANLTTDDLWKRHEDAFSVQRITEQFFEDYRWMFGKIQALLQQHHPSNGQAWARNYTHQLLNRIMFIYFIARKGWLLGPDGNPDRDFMRHFWEAYRNTNSKDRFHADWLSVLFFEAFNNRWQNRHDYRQRFPQWLVNALAQAPYLNGGLYARHPDIDDSLQTDLPDPIFALLFDQWHDGTFPGLFERYNFTVVETDRFDEEVAVDPEMLGTVYERLVNLSYDQEDPKADLRGTAGVFYTPRTEIDLMCRLALTDWLTNQLGEPYKPLLYQWVFAFAEEDKESADRALTDAGLWEPLSNLVRRVRVCDPACGSGAFLVGMMLVLDDLQTRCNRALGEPETPYQRRRRILQDQLYGVDVMEWAVRVAELRLWLQLVVETELNPHERHLQPLLPNLDLKLRPGDSLLQTVGNIDLSPFRRSELPLPPPLKGRLTQLKGKKRRHFQGEEPNLSTQTLKNEELHLFRDILQAKIEEIGTQVQAKRQEAHSRQLSLEGMGTPPDDAKQSQLEAEIEALEQQILRFQEALNTLRPDQPTPFVWDLAFVEIFEDERPGFDIVIGNPPYVRQEKIRDYLGRFERKEYLNHLNESLRAIYPHFMGKKRQLSGRADYYVYFYLHALSLLAEKGTFCFITSNSWLDVDFGKDLQAFFLRYAHLKMVIDNRAKRSFAQADVNTVIVLASAPERKRNLTDDPMKQRPVRFIAFRVPFEAALSPVVFLEIEDHTLYQSLAGFRVLVRPEYRVVLTDQGTLYQEGLEQPEESQVVQMPQYAGNKWGGKYLRAPDIFFTILEKGKGKLVRLGDIAEVRRGFTTGANEFFYLEPMGMTVKQVAALRAQDPHAPVPVKNGAGWQGELEAAWLRPVVKSPREIKTLQVRLEDLRYLVFMPPHEVRSAIAKKDKKPYSPYPLAEAYIRWGEKQGYPKRPTCASRQWWWDLGGWSYPNLLWSDAYNTRYLVADSNKIYADKRFFFIYFDGACATLTAYLNCTVTPFFIELNGISNLGEGAIYTNVYWLKTYPVLTKVSKDREKQLNSVLERLSQRPILSIFEELGLPKPNRDFSNIDPDMVSLDKVLPDRRALDAVVFEVLGLTEAEQLAVYRAVVELVKARLVKARSV